MVVKKNEEKKHELASSKFRLHSKYSRHDGQISQPY